MANGPDGDGILRMVRCGRSLRDGGPDADGPVGQLQLRAGRNHADGPSFNHKRLGEVIDAGLGGAYTALKACEVSTSHYRLPPRGCLRTRDCDLQFPRKLRFQRTCPLAVSTSRTVRGEPHASGEFL